MALLLLGIGISMTNLMKKNIKLVNMLVIMGLVLAFAQNFAAIIRLIELEH